MNNHIMQRLKSWWTERATESDLKSQIRTLTRERDGLDERVVDLKTEVFNLSEQIEIEKSRNVIQKKELEMLTAVCQRDLERVIAESAIGKNHE